MVFLPSKLPGAGGGGGGGDIPEAPGAVLYNTPGGRPGERVQWELPSSVALPTVAAFP